MPKWPSLRSADDVAQRLGNYAGAIAAIAAAFAAAVAIVSWVTHSISALAAYGWGLPVLVAIGVVLVIVMGLGFAAVPAVEAWRKYHPPTTEPRSPLPDLSPEIGHLQRQLEVFIEGRGKDLELLKLSLPPLEQQGRDLATRIDQFGADIVRLNELGVSQHQVNDDIRAKLDRQGGAQAVILADLRNLERKFGFFIKAIRAGDAQRDVLLPNDKTAMVLGKRLAEAKAVDYADPASWLSDYQQWHTAARVIDHLVVSWAKAEGFGGYAPLLDLEPRHFQHSPMPPENIRTDDTIIPFKTVWHAQSSYGNQRDNIFSFFETLAAFPG
jgi:hypothetical protein